MSSTGTGIDGSGTAQGWARWEPLTGIAFVICFIGSVVVSSVPADNASNQDWVAAFTGHTHQVQHLTTGLLLVLAALCLMSFLTIVWTRIAAAPRPAMLSPLPIVAAGVSSACIAVGGILMAGISGSALIGSAPVPAADLLRLGNDLGFAMVGIAGMCAAALSIACLSGQAHAVGLFGGKLLVFGRVVAVVLLGSVAFVPIIALLLWLIVVSVVLMRGPGVTVRGVAVSALSPRP
jgi:hypothetical protein